MNRGDRAESNRCQTDSQSVSGNQHRIRPQRKERELNPQDAFTFDRLPTGSRRQSGGPSVIKYLSNIGPTRIRTRNARVEAGCDFDFTIRPVIERKARESNPQGPEAARLSKPARQAISGYLPFQWTHRESNPDLRYAIAVSSLWTMSPSNCHWT